MTISSDHEPIVKFMRQYKRENPGAERQAVLNAAQNEFSNRDQTELMHCYVFVEQTSRKPE